MKTTTKSRYAWKEVLRDQGRSIAWLADRTATPRATVYSYACGARRPASAWLEKAAAALGVDVADVTDVAA